MMRRMLLFAVVAALPIVTAVSLPHPASAGEPSDQLKADMGRVLKALEQPARRDAVSAVSRDLFDWTEMARRSLGSHWNVLSDGERAEFTGLLARLVDARLLALAGYAGDAIEFVGETVDADGAVVQTVVNMTNRRPMALDYRMHRRGARWLIYDVVLDGASMVRNYRAQFAHVIKTASYEKLIEKLATQ